MKLKLPPHLKQLLPAFIGLEVLILPFTFLDGWFGDMAKNLWTEIFASSLLLFIVDHWIRQREEEALRPAKTAMFYEAVQIEIELIGLINRISLKTIEQGDVEIVRDVRKGGSILPLANILSRLPMSEKDDLNLGTWAEHLHGSIATTNTMIEKFMSRYVSIATPGMISSIQMIDRSSMFVMARMPNILNKIPIMPSNGWDDLLTGLGFLINSIRDSREEWGIPQEKRFRSWKLLSNIDPEELQNRKL